MQISMQQRCNARVQAFQAAPKKLKASPSSPTQFAGLRANLLDADRAMTGSLSQVCEISSDTVVFPVILAASL